MTTFKEYLSRDGASASDKEFLKDYEKAQAKTEEGPISHNGRMVDKDNIAKGLLALSGYLSNEVDADNFNSGSNDYNYYQEAIQAARDYLLED